MSTTPTPRLYSASKIQRGAADLWLGLVAPASGTHVITLATDGSPDATTNPAAVHAGLLSVPSVLTYTPKLDFEMVDQDTGPVAAFLNTEDAVIEVELAETEYDRVMALCVPAGGGFKNTTVSEGVTFGAGANIPVTPLCIAAIAKSADPLFGFAVALLYKAVPAAAVKLTFGRTKSAVCQVQFKGLSDLTRTAGDRIGSVYKTTVS